MPLGPHIPAWAELEKALSSIADDTMAFNVYVLDAGCALWCAAHRFTEVTPEPIAQLTRRILGDLQKPLGQGGSIDVAISDARGQAYVRSFAGAYILFLRFAGSFDEGDVRDRVGRGITRIEELTTMLPAHKGSGNGISKWRPRL